PQTFSTFIDAVAASGQARLTRVDPATPLGKQHVLATANLASYNVAIVRVVEAEMILDLVSNTDGKKAPQPAEVARRFALAPAHAFSASKGARRLFAPDAAAVVYVDGRHLQPLFAAMTADERQRELRWAAPADKAKVAAKQRE